MDGVDNALLGTDAGQHHNLHQQAGGSTINQRVTPHPARQRCEASQPDASAMLAPPHPDRPMLHAISTTERFLIAMALIFSVPYLIWRVGRTDYFAPLVVVQIVTGIGPTRVP